MDENSSFSASCCIRARRSIRQFLPYPVSRSILHAALSLAQFAPSNSNIQPWRLFITTDAAKDRLRDALSIYAAAHDPILNNSLPEEYQRFRYEMGKQLYGPNGYDVPYGDEAARKNASARNYRFFDAPVAVVVCIDRNLHDQDVLSVGLYLQTLVLALTERGLGSCIEVSVAGYEDLLRRELEFGQELKVLCGLAIGYADPDSRLNHLTVQREPFEKNVVILEK
jgi:nitroreductase